MQKIQIASTIALLILLSIFTIANAGGGHETYTPTYSNPSLAPIITVIVSVFAGEKIADHLYG